MPIDTSDDDKATPSKNGFDQSRPRDLDGVQTTTAVNMDDNPPLPLHHTKLKMESNDDDPFSKLRTCDSADSKAKTWQVNEFMKNDNNVSSDISPVNKPNRKSPYNVHFEDDEHNGGVHQSKESASTEQYGRLNSDAEDSKYKCTPVDNVRKTRGRVPSPIKIFRHSISRDLFDQSERAIRPASPGILSPRLFVNRAGSPAILTIDQSPLTIQIDDQLGAYSPVPTEDAINTTAFNRQDSVYSNASSQDGERGKIESDEESPKLTKSQVLTFFSLAIATFLDQVSFSVLAPFFPREANEKGVSSLQVGLIFGAFALINVIFAPVFGKFLPKLGAKFTFVSGIWIVAGCNILFGFCDDLTSTTQFTVFCYVIRCTAAIGTAAGVTASMAIVANTFPHHVAQAVSLIETFSGLGYMVGPVIGGFLYEVGGGNYKIPFIVLGCLDMLCVVINLALLPPINCADTKPGSITQFLSIPAVWPVGIVIFVSSAAFGFLDPTLSLHVKQFTDSAMVVGLLFLLAGGCYALSSPFWGWITEKLNISRLLVIIGTILSGASFLLMGPSPLFNLPNKLWIICVSLFLSGIFLSASILSSFNDFLMSALKRDLPDNISTQAIVSGVFNSLSALGNFVGPSVGGVAVEAIGFDWSVTFLAGAQVGVAILLALFTLGEYCYPSRRRSTPLSPQVMPPVNDEDLVHGNLHVEPLLNEQT